MKRFASFLILSFGVVCAMAWAKPDASVLVVHKEALMPDIIICDRPACPPPGGESVAY